jgi:hypothetical protein
MLNRKELGLDGRDPKYLDQDIAALRAMAQLTIDVELFTIPLYMNAMSSLHGFHALTFKGFDGYAGRMWPGLGPTLEPNSPNEQAYNTLYGVFLQEMFHLELAGNLASAIGQRPLLKGNRLQNSDNGWNCYRGGSIIPGIVDLQDTKCFKDVKVELGTLTDSLPLFLAIELPAALARSEVIRNQGKYFPKVPFESLPAGKAIPEFFGSIGYLYECYAKYASIRYTDEPDNTLFERLYIEQKSQNKGLQRELFNNSTRAHPLFEFPGVRVLSQAEKGEDVYDIAIDIMSAIVDQGEGAVIDPSTAATMAAATSPMTMAQALLAPSGAQPKGYPSGRTSMRRYKKEYWGIQNVYDEVDERNRTFGPALEVDYPSFDDKGKKEPQSTSAFAREKDDNRTHYQQFSSLMVNGATLRYWNGQADDVTVGDLERDPNPSLATPAEIIAAMGRLRADTGNSRHKFNQMAVGALYGVVQSLHEYWGSAQYTLPLGAMKASVTRFSTYWAICGAPPDLTCGIGNPDDLNTLHNACQGLSFSSPGNTCAAAPAYHTCAGANSCRTQGACGTVATDCEQVIPAPMFPCAKRSATYSPPGDNQCKIYGGCAVPISASQLLRVPGSAPDATFEMFLYSFPDSPPFQPQRLDQKLSFKQKDSVYTKAWEAYLAVRAAEKPVPPVSDIRLVLSPV